MPPAEQTRSHLRAIGGIRSQKTCPPKNTHTETPRLSTISSTPGPECKPLASIHPVKHSEAHWGRGRVLQLSTESRPQRKTEHQGPAPPIYPRGNHRPAHSKHIITETHLQVDTDRNRDRRPDPGCEFASREPHPQGKLPAPGSHSLRVSGMQTSHSPTHADPDVPSHTVQGSCQCRRGPPGTPLARPHFRETSENSQPTDTRTLTCCSKYHPQKRVNTFQLARESRFPNAVDKVRFTPLPSVLGEAYISPPKRLTEYCLPFILEIQFFYSFFTAACESLHRFDSLLAREPRVEDAQKQMPSGPGAAPSQCRGGGWREGLV